MVPYVKWEWCVDKYFFFSMKIYFQKNIEAEICEILRMGWAFEKDSILCGENL